MIEIVSIQSYELQAAKRRKNAAPGVSPGINFRT